MNIARWSGTVRVTGDTLRPLRRRWTCFAAFPLSAQSADASSERYPDARRYMMHDWC